jgi:hypothetical protein
MSGSDWLVPVLKPVARRSIWPYGYPADLAGLGAFYDAFGEALVLEGRFEDAWQ